jgi:RND family efflux transporter MFP subunit
MGEATKQKHLLGLVLGILVMGQLGCDKIEPGRIKAGADNTFQPAKSAEARIEEIPEWYQAVGTIRPRTETSIEARVTGQVLSVRVSPGNRVSKGDLLVALDARQLKAQLDQAQQALKSAVAGREQAKQALAAAEASFRQAELSFKRIQNYYKSQAATAQDLERAEAAFLTAKAEVGRAKEGLTATEARISQAEAVVGESTIALEYARITAPEAGVVLKRFVEPGDLALPGKPLLTLRTKDSLRLEAHVREGLIAKMIPGSQLDVELGTLSVTVTATIEEIIPYADPKSRTFLVKAALPDLAGLYPGMFAKLLIPVRTHSVVVVPLDAIRRVGQLELIYVKRGENWHRRYVKTGRRIGGNVEILSGLSGNEAIGWGGSQDV